MMADMPSVHDAHLDHQAAQPVPEAEQAAHHLTIAEYAERAGVSEFTVRRKICRSELLTEIVDGPYGPEYRILLAEQPDRRGRLEHAQERQAVRAVGGPPLHNGKGSLHRTTDPDIGELITLVREQQQTILELADRCGFLAARVQSLEEEIRSLTASVSLLGDIPADQVTAATGDLPHPH